MATSENENVDIGCDDMEMEGNEKERMACNDTNESVSMPIGSNSTVEPSNKKLKSVVWNHFDPILVDGVRRYAKCKYCTKKLTGRSSDGTTHLKEHFNKCPRRTVKDIKQQILLHEQMTKDGKSSSLSNYVFNAQTSREDIANMIALHDYPISMVEHYGFRKYSKGIGPLFTVPCRATTKSDIMKIYGTKRGVILESMEKNESRIALTSDLWTANKQNKGYMAITAHYIDANWKLQNRLISFIYVPSPHTADAISQHMVESFMDWNIDNKLSTLTLDNCSTNDALIDRLLGTLSPSSLILKGRLFHMRCCAHIINLIVQDGFSIIESSIKKVRDSVSYWSTSPKRAQEFRLVARQVGVDCEKELVLDCKTRWNSIYLMLKVALEYKDVFTRLGKKDRHYVNSPSEKEWRMASNVCNKLEVFYRVTKTFSGTKYATSNLFFPLVCEMKVSLRSWQQDAQEDDVIKNMASCMLEKFDKYWTIIHDVMSVAIVLDPRYKLKLINYFFPKIYGIDSKDRVMWIRNLCNDLFEEYKKRHESNKGKGQSGSTSSHGGVTSSNKASWELDFETMISEDDICERTELDDYLAEKLLPNEKEFDVLVWWKCNGAKFPILQTIARDVLAIPLTTVASESAFSMSGNKVTKGRSRLHPKTLEALMCNQSWLRKEIEDEKDGESKAFDQTVEYDEDEDEDDDDDS